MATRKECDAAVRDVASALAQDESRFRERAASAATQLGPDSIATLMKLTHTECTPPEALAEQFQRLGGWLAARQFAIFEILFHFREAALPTLRRIAFGQYDWTQGNAIEVLCRLASEDVDRNVIMDELKREFPQLRLEAQLYAVGPLLAQAQNNPALADALRELDEVVAFRNAVKELTGQEVH